MSRVRRPAWHRASDESLLDLRFSDLSLRMKDTMVAGCIRRLYDELRSCGLKFRPHFWFSTEWFCPDGVPGVAVPFYLGHPRLAKLEERQMLEVEGGTVEWCMKILRHECGHAIDNAFRLRRRKEFREHFGKSGTPYPDTYSPIPNSKRFVLHLNWWYAQSHPVEDFAETFAVWLKPGRRWRREYHGWPALAKLEYVDELVRSLAGQRPPVVEHAQVDALPDVRTKLKTHYKKRRARYGVFGGSVHDRDLRRLFSDDPKHAAMESGAAFLRRLGPELRERVAFWTGQHQYAVDQVIDEMISRCKLLGLRRAVGERESRLNVLILVTAQTMELVHRGLQQVTL